LILSHITIYVSCNLIRKLVKYEEAMKAIGELNMARALYVDSVARYNRYRGITTLEDMNTKEAVYNASNEKVVELLLLD